jgi:hypothetical protein
LNPFQILLQTDASIFVVTDQKSLSNEPFKKADLPDFVTITTRSFVSKTHELVEWVANNSPLAVPSPRGQNNETFDIEMSALPSNDQSILHASATSSSVNSVADSPSAANQCVICLSKPADCLLQDCGHLCCCVYCALSVARRSPGQCPLCRTNITTMLRLKDAPFALADGKIAAISNVTYYLPTAVTVDRKSMMEQRLIPEITQRLENHDSLLELMYD